MSRQRTIFCLLILSCALMLFAASRMGTASGIQAGQDDDARLSAEPRARTAASPRTSLGVVPLPVVAYGLVSRTGTLISGKGVTSVSWSAANSKFLIKLTGINFSYRDYIVLGTAVGNYGYTVQATSTSGKLVIYLTDPDGAPVAYDFWFVVFKP